MSKTHTVIMLIVASWLLSACTQVVVHDEHSDELEFQWQVTEDMLNRAALYRQHGHLEQSKSQYRELIERFESSPDAPIQDQVAKARHLSSYAYTKLQDRVLYRDAINRLQFSDDPDMPQQVSEAMLRLAETYENEPEQAIMQYRSLIERFQGSKGLGTQRHVAEARVSLAAIYVEQDQSALAIAQYRSLIEQFKHSDQPYIEELVAVGAANLMEISPALEKPLKKDITPLHKKSLFDDMHAPNDVFVTPSAPDTVPAVIALCEINKDMSKGTILEAYWMSGPENERVTVTNTGDYVNASIVVKTQGYDQGACIELKIKAEDGQAMAVGISELVLRETVGADGVVYFKKPFRYFRLNEN